MGGGTDKFGYGLGYAIEKCGRAFGCFGISLRDTRASFGRARFLANTSIHLAPGTGQMLRVSESIQKVRLRIFSDTKHLAQARRSECMNAYSRGASLRSPAAPECPARYTKYSSTIQAGHQNWFPTYLSDPSPIQHLSGPPKLDSQPAPNPHNPSLGAGLLELQHQRTFGP